MTKLLLILKRAAAAYPRLKRAAGATGYPLLQQTHNHARNNLGRSYAAAPISASRAVGSLPTPTVLSGGRAASTTAGSPPEASEKDKDAKFMNNVLMTRKFYPTKLAVVAFALICALLALDQSRKQRDSISKDINEVRQKMKNLTEVVQIMRDKLEKGNNEEKKAEGGKY